MHCTELRCGLDGLEDTIFDRVKIIHLQLGDVGYKGLALPFIF